MSTTPMKDRLTQSYEYTRPYVPTLVQRIVLTYIVPIVTVLLVATLGSRLLVALLPFVPLSTATILIFAANVLILVRGWQWLEKRFGATRLFVLYTLVSRDRRDLKRLLAQSSVDGAAVAHVVQQLERSEQNFVTAAQSASSVIGG